MVLTKLFNILTITTSMGSGILNIPSRTIKRTNTEYPINEEVQLQQNYNNAIYDQTEQLQEALLIFSGAINQGTQYITLYNNFKAWEYSFQNSYISGNIIYLQTSTIYYEANATPINSKAYNLVPLANEDLDNKKVNFNKTYATTNGNKTITHTSLPGFEELYFIKLDTTGQIANYDIKIENIKYNFDLALKMNGTTAIETNQKYMRMQQMLTTTQSYMIFDNAFKQSQIQGMFQNGLYETYTNVIFENNAKGSVKEDIEEYENTHNNLYSCLNEVEAPIYKNKTTYYVIYNQPRIIKQNNQTENTALIENFNSNNANSESITTYTFRGYYVINPSTVEVVDVPGVMFYVLGMPFTFISTAFGLTLFPGTAYELNISILFLSIFAVLVFIFIVKLVIRVFK